MSLSLSLSHIRPKEQIEERETFARFQGGSSITHVIMHSILIENFYGCNLLLWNKKNTLQLALIKSEIMAARKRIERILG